MYKLFLTKEQVQERLHNNFRIEDDLLERIDIEIIPHYGWLPCFQLNFSKSSPINPHNNLSNLGYILHVFMQLFDIREDGERLSKFIDKPVRLVYNEKAMYTGKCLAVGHPWKDKFIFFEDLMKVNGSTYD